MVTAELAVVLPVVVLMLGALLGAGTAAMDSLRCVDAARAAARAAARHDSAAEVLGAARATAPTGAAVQVQQGAGEVRVTVSSKVHFVVPGLPPLEVRGSAVADLEQTGAVPRGAPSPGGAQPGLFALCLVTRRRLRRLRRRRQAREDAVEPSRTGPGPVHRPVHRPVPGPVARPRDGGAGSLLALGLVMATFTFAAGAAWVGQVFVARHQAASAADLASLAAATAGADCERAAAVAAANGAQLVSCSAGAAGVVDVVVRVSAGAGVSAVAVHGSARAGPVHEGWVDGGGER